MSIHATHLANCTAGRAAPRISCARVPPASAPRRRCGSPMLRPVRSQDKDQEPSTSSPPAQEDEPIWVRREREREVLKDAPKDLPFGAYLLFSAMVAIAAVGSVFEYAAKNPIFDVIPADSPFYAPILGTFAVTGLPTAAVLFFKAVEAANRDAERMDQLDGYKK